MKAVSVQQIGTFRQCNPFVRWLSTIQPTYTRTYLHTLQTAHIQNLKSNWKLHSLNETYKRLSVVNIVQIFWLSYRWSTSNFCFKRGDLMASCIMPINLWYNCAWLWVRGGAMQPWLPTGSTAPLTTRSAGSEAAWLTRCECEGLSSARLETFHPSRTRGIWHNRETWHTARTLKSVRINWPPFSSSASDNEHIVLLHALLWRLPHGLGEQ